MSAARLITVLAPADRPLPRAFVLPLRFRYIAYIADTCV
jgi:hypothetical protein